MDIEYLLVEHFQVMVQFQEIEIIDEVHHDEPDDLLVLLVNDH